MGPQEGSQGPVGSDSAQGPSLGTTEVGPPINYKQFVALFQPSLDAIVMSKWPELNLSGHVLALNPKKSKWT